MSPRTYTSKPIIAVIGGHQRNTNAVSLQLAEAAGAELARRGFAIICGGLSGIMEAACKGCREAGGTTIGLMKGNERAACNPYIDYAVLTSMDVASNNVIIWSAAGVLAFDGRYGTLNEIALALDFGKPLVVMGRQPLLDASQVDSPRFAHFPSYDRGQIPVVINRLVELIEEADRATR